MAEEIKMDLDETKAQYKQEKDSLKLAVRDLQAQLKASNSK